MATSPAVSAAYRAVMTPISLVSFLISLALIDVRYTAARAASPENKVPVWLRRVLCPKHSSAGGPEPCPPRRNADQDGTEAYYHSKQRELMRLEAEGAFRIRTAVAVALGLLALALAVALTVAALFLARFALRVAYRAVAGSTVA